MYVDSLMPSHTDQIDHTDHKIQHLYITERYDLKVRGDYAENIK